jgi:hypothetical protein
LDGFDFYAEWLEVPVDCRPPNHYELLGLKTGESDAALIRAASIERSARVRRYCLGPHGAEATRLLGELGAAFACLSDPETKAAYDRPLLGNVAADSSADVSPPPIQRPFDASEAPPRRSTVAEKKASPVARSDLWLRRRQVASSAPARFTIAAALLLAVTCGAIWFQRRPPDGLASSGKEVRPTSLASVPAVASSRDEPFNRNQKSTAPAAPTDAVPPSLPPPGAKSESSVERSSPTVRAETAPEGAPKDDLPAVPSSNDTNEEAGAPSVGPQGSDTPDEPPPAPSKENDPLLAVSKLLDKVQGGQPAGKKARPAGGQDRARVLPPGAMWRLNAGDQPESLEVTFENPVDAAHIELFEPVSPAMIDQAVIESADGSTAEIKPVPVFHQDGVRRWSFGSTRRAPTKRLLIRFRPTTDGVVDLAGVAVRDRSGDVLFPTLVRAVNKVGDRVNTAPATGDEDQGTGAEAEDPIEELARQELTIAQNKQPRRAADYAKFLGDPSYVKTKAAIEAVADLEQIVNETPKSSDAKLARGLLARLARTKKDTPLGEEASRVLRSTNYRSP